MRCAGAVAGVLWFVAGCGAEVPAGGADAAQSTAGVAAPSSRAGAGGVAVQSARSSGAGLAGAIAGAGGAGAADLPSRAPTAAGAAGGFAASAPAAGGGSAVAEAGSGVADAGAPAAGGGGALSSAANAGTGADETASAPVPQAKFMVPATGPCPEFRDGYAMFTPDGKQRRVLLYTSGKTDKRGPLLFSWHSTLPNPEDAVSWIGQSVINEIKAQGGVVAAPSTAYPNEVRPWDNTPMGAQNVDGDQRLMDEIVACAIEKLDIDTRRIHATGMSAGGLKSADVSLRRSGYLASVIVYSGGLTKDEMPPDQDPMNPLAAMILYGGATDISPVDSINYTDASNRYLDRMRARGGFAFLCNHGGGHSVPRDSQASAWRFLQDHPFGTRPSPYATQLPSGFLRYCMLPK